MTHMVDDSYETLCLDYHPARIYDTTLRCWRWVLLAPWRIGRPAMPADPDAALDEAAKLFPGPRPDVPPPPIVMALEGTLRCDGPLTVATLEEYTGYPRARCRRQMEVRPQTFAIVYEGGGKTYWGLVGEHEDWQPPLRDAYQDALALLHEHGELSTPQLKQLGVDWRVPVVLRERGLVTRRSVLREGHITHYWQASK